MGPAEKFPLRFHPERTVVKTIQQLHQERALMAFRERFVRLRKQHGWTQQQVADKIGLSVGQVKKYEKGTSAPTLQFLAQIATVFGVSTDVLVFDNDSGVASKKLDADLLGRFEKVSHLPPRERDAILVLIDSVIAKQTLREVIGG